MINVALEKFRGLTDKVTNVVMSYTEVEAKVREATNDDAWGPTGPLMQEIAQYTYTYEHFAEVMGMLWKRMLIDNTKNWRRTYKSLRLLNYLLLNGSERVVSSTREHLYDMRGLENYSFTDDMGRDQGINVRQKVKEIIALVQDDEALRTERKKTKKNKDKYVGIVGGGGGGPSSFRYNDDYENDEPRPSRRTNQLDDRDWQIGNKSIAEEAIDKVKEFVGGIKIFDSQEDRFGDDDEEISTERRNYIREDDEGYGADSERVDRSGYRDRYSNRDGRNETDRTEPPYRSSRSKETNEKQNQKSAVQSNTAAANGDFADFADFKSADDFQSRTSAVGTTIPKKTVQLSSVPSAAKPRRPSGGQLQLSDDSPVSLPKSQTVPSLQSLSPPRKPDPTNTDLLGSLLLDLPTAPPAALNSQQQFSAPGMAPSIQQTHSNPLFSPTWQPGPNASLMPGSTFPGVQQFPTTLPASHQPVPPSLLDTGDMTFQNSMSGVLAPSVKAAAVDVTTSSQTMTASQPLKANSLWSGANVNINLDNLVGGGKAQKSSAPSMKQLQLGQTVPVRPAVQPGTTIPPQGMMGFPQQPSMMGVPQQQGMMGFSQPQGMMGYPQPPAGMGMTQPPVMIGNPQQFGAGGFPTQTGSSQMFYAQSTQGTNAGFANFGK